MRIEVGQEGNLILKEVFNPVILETAEGNMLVAAMRDDTVELHVPGTDKRYRVDMETGEIYQTGYAGLR